MVVVMMVMPDEAAERPRDHMVMVVMMMVMVVIENLGDLICPAICRRSGVVSL
jgi:hypothetical protein